MLKRTSTLVAIGFLLSPVFAACGKSNEAGHTAITGTVDGFAGALCSFAFRCCSAGEVGYYVAPFVNDANCKERLMDAALAPPSVGLSIPAFHGLTVSIPNLGALDRAVREKRTQIDGAALTKCEDYLKNLGCNTPTPPPDPTAPYVCKPFDPPPEDTACDPAKIFVGQLHEGDECTSYGASFECAPGLYCGTNSDLGVKGQCIATGHQGDFCFQDYECDQGLYCSLLDGTCQPPRDVNETCVYADHLDPNPDPATLLVKCRSDLSCDPITHTCVAHCQQGAECSQDTDCDDTKGLTCITGRCDTPRDVGLPCGKTADCKDGLRCITNPANPSQEICADRLQTGQPCTADTDCQSTFCDLSSGTPGTCTAQVLPGGLCPAGVDSQCKNGSCSGKFAIGNTCSTNTDCSGGRCNLTTTPGSCQAVCVALKPENAQCTADTDCLSNACIAGLCRTPPLGEGVECTSDSQCTTGFCSIYTTGTVKRVCTKLPLVDGTPCNYDDQCESLVCFANTFGIDVCTAGLKAGNVCGGGNAPCDPKTLYCDYSLDVPQCAPLHETGEACKSGIECRGSCVLRDGRYMCNDVPAPGAAICDGK